MSKLKYTIKPVISDTDDIRGNMVTTYKKKVGIIDIVSIVELEDKTIQLYIKDSTWKTTFAILPRDAFDKLVRAINNESSVNHSSTGELK